jgi:hypothetical protein
MPKKMGATESMKISREERLSQAFVLTVQDLEKLHDRLKRWVGYFNFEIVCGDSLTREFTAFSQLIQFENSPKKDIKSLRLKGYSQDWKNRVWVVFDASPSRNIYVSMEGDEEAVLDANNSIEETLTAIKPWYALLARTDFTLVFSAIIFVPAVIVVLAIGIGLIKLRADPSFGLNSGISSFYKGITLALIPVIFGVLLNKIRNAAFPTGVFAIGQGAKRHKDKEITRTVVVVGFFISLLSSIVATLLFTIWR